MTEITDMDLEEDVDTVAVLPRDVQEAVRSWKRTIPEVHRNGTGRWVGICDVALHGDALTLLAIAAGRLQTAGLL
jgi:hypothetical protein